MPGRRDLEIAGLRRLAESPRVPIDLRAEAVLTMHQRLDPRGCLCGFDRLGASFVWHQVQMLSEAGLLAATAVDGG